MIPVLDAKQMRAADRVTIRVLGLPGMVLMESAASAVTEVVADRFAEAKRVLVACGPGNNGGDGLAVARQLRCRGFAVDVALMVGESELKGDAAAQLELAHRFGVTIHRCGSSVSRLADLTPGAAVIVDALFGTGLDRPLEGRWAKAVGMLNGAGVPIVSVDVPSGLQGSFGEVAGATVEASVTVTFAAPKVAHVLPPACWRCGEVAVAEIGIPPWVVQEQATMGLIEGEDVATWLPIREADAHKGNFGHLLVVAGREGRAGAAALAARAAVTLGAGLVTVATAHGAVRPVQAQVPEAMVDPLPAGKDGAVSGAGLEGSLGKATALAVGPGLGVTAGPHLLLDKILEEWTGPLVLDADALTLLAGRLEVLRRRTGPTVLTPHPGELGRLLGVPTSDVAKDRLQAAQEASRRSGAVVLAKGARTVIVGGGASSMVNPTGTPGLASGGAGDVLTGVIGALLAQGVPAREAAAAGAWLHGRAAELAGERFPAAVPAGSLVEELSRAELEARRSA